MGINLGKEYRFADGEMISTDTGKEYPFLISKNDRFYHYMRKHIMKGKVESLTCENIDEISIKDNDETFFDERSFTLNARMIVFKDNSEQLYIVIIKNVMLKEVNKFSTKSYEDGYWKLGLYSLEIPYQTDINIIEVQDDE